MLPVDRIPHQNQYSRLPNLSIAYPVRGLGSDISVMILRVSIVAVWDLINHLELAPSEYAYLLDRRGELIALA